MKNDALKLEKRGDIGGGKGRRLRGHGMVPAVVYGRGMEPAPALVKSADLREFMKYHGKNSVFHTEFAEEHDIPILLKDIQYDPFQREVVHLDFQKVDSDERVQVEIPVRVIGREQVEKQGNVVVHQLNSVKVECLPGDIPQHADANIASLKPGHSFTAGDFTFGQSVSLISRPSEVILTVNGRDQTVVPEAAAGEI